jgi:hypothetical protein
MRTSEQCRFVHGSRADSSTLGPTPHPCHGLFRRQMDTFRIGIVAWSCEDPFPHAQHSAQVCLGLPKPEGRAVSVTIWAVRGEGSRCGLAESSEQQAQTELPTIKAWRIVDVSRYEYSRRLHSSKSCINIFAFLTSITLLCGSLPYHSDGQTVVNSRHTRTARILAIH